MNLFILADGRRTFYQWDTNRQLIVNDPTCTEVHFCNGTGDCSLRRSVNEQNGLRVVDVPNILLQDTKSVTVFAYVRTPNCGYTRRAVVFPVRGRSKPEDYIYTEKELLTWEKLEKRITDLELAKDEHAQRLDDLERTTVKSVNGIGPDENGNVDVDGMPDDIDQLKLLIETDMLPAIHLDGAILTDENGNVILRF